MTGKYSPGPWDFGADACPDNEVALAICKENIDAHTAGSNGYFYVTYLPDGRRTAMVGHGPNAAANARLIAAAPELLEALEFVMTAHGEQLSTAFEQAQEALTKALGRPWPDV